MKRFIALLLAGVMIFALTACGTTPTTDTPDTSATTGTTEPAVEGEKPATASTVQGVTDTEIIVANSAATSGAYAPVGVPFNAGIEAYFKMVNESGGINGRTVKFVHYTDDEFDPVKGKAALSGMVEDEKVFAIVGHFGTPVVSATIDDLKEYGIPSVYFATGIGQLYADKATTNEEGYNIFPVQPIYRTEGQIMVAYASTKFEAKKIGVIYTNDDAGMNLRDGINDQIALMDGVELVEEMVTAGTADVSAAVTSIKNADVDFVIVAAIQATMPTIVKEMAAQSVNKDCITTYVNVSGAMSAAVVEDIQGKFDVYGLGWVAYDNQESLAEYQAFIDPEYAMNAYAQTGWIAAHFFSEGVRRVGENELTWESYMAALEEAPIQNPFGGVIDFSDGQRKGTQEMNLSKVVAVTEEFPAGWEAVAPLASVSSLLEQK